MTRPLLVPAALFAAVSWWTKPAFAIDFPSTAACPNPVELEYGVGCMCTADSCGTYPVVPTPPSLTEALVITTSPENGFLNHQTVSVDNDLGGSNCMTMNITVDPDVTFQDILGFGAAITDAVVYALTGALKGDGTLVDTILRQAFVHANFSMARVNMNGCDFSRMDYALSHELDLSDFCLRDDRTPDGEEVTCGEDYKLDLLERIIALRPELKVFVSSWSASPTFKHQNFTCDLHHHVIECQPDENTPAQVECVRTVTDPDTCGGQPQGVPCNTTPPANYSQGFPLSNSFDEKYNTLNIPSKNADGNCYNTGFLRDDAYASWAGLYAKFIEAYANRSVPIWGITSQNEPWMQTGLWQSNFWTVEGLVKFVNEYLMPAVRKVQPDIQIIMYDDQLINLTNTALQLAEGTMDNSNGIAFHWYTSLESIYENDQPQESFPDMGLPLVGGGAGVKTLYDAFNGSKFLLMTESCSGYSFGTDFVGPRHGSFGYGYNAAHDLLWDVRNRATGYVYWNLVLDSLGGPNLAGNYVDSPMYVTGNGTAVVMNPSFFYLTHFSRAVPPGSVVIQADVECGASRSEYCQFVAFRTPKEDVVVVMTNDKITTDLIAPLPLPPLAKGQGEPIEWTIRCKASTVRGVLPWKGIQTVIMPCSESTSSPALTFSRMRAVTWFF